MNAPQQPAARGDDIASGLSEEVKARYRNLPRPPQFAGTLAASTDGCARGRHALSGRSASSSG